MTVAIVDYGSGNLRSAAKAFERAAREAGTHERILVTASTRDVIEAARIVLPGVGAFADCRAGLYGVPGMVETLQREVIERGKPFLGSHTRTPSQPHAPVRARSLVLSRFCHPQARSTADEMRVCNRRGQQLRDRRLIRPVGCVQHQRPAEQAQQQDPGAGAEI